MDKIKFHPIFDWILLYSNQTMQSSVPMPTLCYTLDYGDVRCATALDRAFSCMSSLCQPSNKGKNTALKKITHAFFKSMKYCQGLWFLFWNSNLRSLLWSWTGSGRIFSEAALIKSLVPLGSLLLPFNLSWSYFHWFPGKSTFVPLKSKCMDLFIDHPACLGSLTAVTPAHDLSCSIIPPVSSLSETESHVFSCSFFSVFSEFPPTLCVFLSFIALAWEQSIYYLYYYCLPSPPQQQAFTKHNFFKCKNAFGTNCCHLFDLHHCLLCCIFLLPVSNCNGCHRTPPHLPARHSTDRQRGNKAALTVNCSSIK